jgi:arylformamidase
VKPSWILLCVALSATAIGCADDKPPPPRRPDYIVDLSPPLNEATVLRQYGRKAMDAFGLKPRSDMTRVRPADEWHTYGFTYFDLMSHGGAHLDASARLMREGQKPDEVPLDKLFGWARVVDLRWHDKASPITIADLETFKIKPNEIVLLYLGYEPPQTDDWPEYPYLSEPAARWLAGIGVRMVGTDLPSLGSLRRISDLMDKRRPPEEIWASHVPFFEKDIPVVEGLVNLDQVMGEKRMYFSAFPLPVADRSGAPVRAVALIYS